jgi:hypothetical protein
MELEGLNPGETTRMGTVKVCGVPEEILKKSSRNPQASSDTG